MYGDLEISKKKVRVRLSLTNVTSEFCLAHRDHCHSVKEMIAMITLFSEAPNVNSLICGPFLFWQAQSESSQSQNQTQTQTTTVSGCSGYKDLVCLYNFFFIF